MEMLNTNEDVLNEPPLNLDQDETLQAGRSSVLQPEAVEEETTSKACARREFGSCRELNVTRFTGWDY